MLFKEVADAGVDNVLHDFANNRSKRDGSIVFRGISWTLFMKSENVSITPICRDNASGEGLVK